MYNSLDRKKSLLADLELLKGKKVADFSLEWSDSLEDFYLEWVEFEDGSYINIYDDGSWDIDWP